MKKISSTDLQGRRMTNLSGAQIRAARALLRWSAADLVRESGVSPATIHRAESTDGKTTMTFANASAIRRALENAGVELIEENGGGLGARLRRGRSLSTRTVADPVYAFGSRQSRSGKHQRRFAKRTQFCRLRSLFSRIPQVKDEHF